MCDVWTADAHALAFGPSAGAVVLINVGTLEKAKLLPGKAPNTKRIAELEAFKAKSPAAPKAKVGSSSGRIDASLKVHAKALDEHANIRACSDHACRGAHRFVRLAYASRPARILRGR